MSDEFGIRPALKRFLEDRVAPTAAREELLRVIRPYLHWLARQRVHWRNKIEDSDLVQETLLRAATGLDEATAARFRGENARQFVAWLGQIFRNVVADLEDRVLAARRNPQREVPLSEALAVAAAGTAPHRADNWDERVVAIATALEKLPRMQKQVVQWRIFEDLTYDEIAALTGMTANHLRVVFYRAMEQIRNDESVRMLKRASS